MPKILETQHFIISAHDQPHHCRSNGGHVKVSVKEQDGKHFEHPTQMPPLLYSTLYSLVQVTGEAVMNVMTSLGFKIARINYQENGNWAYKDYMKQDPHVHVHLYIRTWEEKHPSGDPRFQAFPDALFFPDKRDPYYKDFQAFTQEDCQAIHDEVLRLLGTTKYQGVLRDEVV